MKTFNQPMCVVNPELVEHIAPLAGGQADIMRRIGISWNSWLKIVAGLPVRHSLGERLKARILSVAHEIDGLRTIFPAANGGVDQAALGAAFLLPGSELDLNCGASRSAQDSRRHERHRVAGRPSPHERSAAGVHYEAR